jgi:predicted nucleic acid-binding protein
MSGVATLFLDTNVLVYARDRSEPVKGSRAQDLLDKIFQAGPPLIRVQVLSEFFWTVTRKLPIPLTPQEAIAEAIAVNARMAHRPDQADVRVLKWPWLNFAPKGARVHSQGRP